MSFEWDPEKSKANKEKHGIDFETAKILWSDDNRVEIHVSYPVEDRWILIGQKDNKRWTAIFTVRGNAIRIISVRRSRKKEADFYEEKSICKK
ncbi:MAG: toxin [Deltaproteobacteria bacterium RBG_13_47_9]|nr:MAG: toxin [Deltaproteobacteria bacterium RBG_13_47_9]